VEQAVAFRALLELRKTGEIEIEQASAFARIRVRGSRDRDENRDEREWIARSA
jgi:chromatin segregation and condensation protein Rec8/ScpA/Scc1 (kleisin family)